jgi:uncharacterized protein with HEPN domain
MLPEKRDPAYIYDMIDSAQSIMQMMAGISYHTFTQDRKLYRAVERELEIIGEAARHVSVEFKNKYPEIPWMKIVATRHRLAHEYAEVKLAIIFRIATIHVVELQKQLQAIMDLLPPPETA